MGRPKGNKGGYVFYDKTKSRWKVQYYILDSKTQKEKCCTKSSTNEKEAKDYFSSIQCQKGNELFIKNNGIPLNELMRANLKRKFDMNLLGETQFSRVTKTIEKLEQNELFHRKIEDLTSEEIQRYLNSLKENYSNSYIKKIYEQISQAFNFAINRGYIIRNPLMDVVKPKSMKKDKVVRAMEIEEQQKFTEYLESKTIAEEPYKNVFLIQMFMGLRVGEALALRYGDIDLRKNVINVNKTLTKDKNERVIMGDTTKTYAGIREVPIPEFIRASIIEQMVIAENNLDKQLFISNNGKLIDGKNVNRILKERLSKLGIKGITTHSLRHTYGTRCVEAGMRAVALQRLMGHTDVSVTLNTYTSVFNKYKASELEKVNQYYIDNALYKIKKPNEELIEGNNLIDENSKADEDKELRRIAIKVKPKFRFYY